jgi:hypothetical protein
LRRPEADRLREEGEGADVGIVAQQVAGNGQRSRS